MSLQIQLFNQNTDTKEYLELLNHNMLVIRGKFVHWLSKKKDKKQLSSFLKESKILTVQFKNEIAGFIVYTENKKSSTIFVEQLHIKSEFRNKGIGTQALHFVEKEASKLKYAKLELEVYAKNPAFQLYKKLGFQKIGYYKKICWWIYRVRKNIPL